MRYREKRILTTHVGSLSRPNDLIELNRRRAAGEAIEPAAYAQLLAARDADPRSAHQGGLSGAA